MPIYQFEASSFRLGQTRDQPRSSSRLLIPTCEPAGRLFQYMVTVPGEKLALLVVKWLRLLLIQIPSFPDRCW